MANTINDLYLKYVNKVGKTLENDRYFRYLFEMVQAGSTTLHQKNQIMRKVVDERWLTTIEESLDAINTVIEKPRRFVTTNEEVVPVALARKITADSVRHLSQNTQFIASAEDGDIQPTRILNVTTEDSYDLYENRFVYHLIQRLVTFIDKRTDIIFWSTGDEKRSVLNMESKVDDAYEQIEYKIEMKITNRQSFAENDAENMDLFMRIDHVRRMVMSLRNSSFCSLMAGCATVRSPIQRTNLIMKDPYYRTCYRLWQFLESYDDVGYTIEAEDTALEFDEEYLLQMYTNLITNYTVFKTMLESDERRITEAENKRRRVIKPKFIKRIEEEIVDDYNIEDVEIRKVIIEEVTQAQLDAEARLAEETARAEQAEKACLEAERRLQGALREMTEASQAAAQAQEMLERAEKARNDAEESLARTTRAANESVAEANRARAAAEKKVADAEFERESAELQRDAALKEKDAALRTAAEDREKCALAESERAAAVAAMAESKKASEEAVRQMHAAQKETERSAAAREKAETARAEAVAQITESQKAAAAAEKTAAAAVKQSEKDREERELAVTARREAEKAKTAAERLAASAEKARLAAQERAEADRAARKTAETACTQAKKEASAVCKQMRTETDAACKQARSDSAEAKRLVAEAKRLTAEAEKARDAAMKDLESERLARAAAEEGRALAEAARDEAVARADANTLSKRILSAWDNRRNRNE